MPVIVNKTIVNQRIKTVRLAIDQLRAELNVFASAVDAHLSKEITPGIERDWAPLDASNEALETILGLGMSVENLSNEIVSLKDFTVRLLDPQAKQQ
jgi:hypothetical protein